MALLTRLGIGGVGRTYGTITDKAESAPPSAPAELLTRIAVGGVGKTYGTITDKTEGIGGTPRPGDIFTRIGVGGVGITYAIADKDASEVISEDTNGYYGTGVKRPKNKEDQIIALIMAMYESGTF